jgi:hypothetical protein
LAREQLHPDGRENKKGPQHRGHGGGGSLAAERIWSLELRAQRSCLSPNGLRSQHESRKDRIEEGERSGADDSAAIVFRNQLSQLAGENFQ